MRIEPYDSNEWNKIRVRAILIILIAYFIMIAWFFGTLEFIDEKIIISDYKMWPTLIGLFLPVVVYVERKENERVLKIAANIGRVMIIISVVFYIFTMDYTGFSDNYVWYKKNLITPVQKIGYAEVYSKISYNLTYSSKGGRSFSVRLYIDRKEDNSLVKYIYIADEKVMNLLKKKKVLIIRPNINESDLKRFEDEGYLKEDKYEIYKKILIEK